MLSSAIEFLVNRGTDVGELTDYEIEERFEEAWKNALHDQIEGAFYAGLTQVTNPREWRAYCDRLHNAVANPQPLQSTGATDLLTLFQSQGVPVLN